MKSIALLCCCLWAVAAWSEPNPVDRKDPAATANAYTEALAKGDTEALRGLVVPDKGVLAMLRIMGGNRQMNQYFSEAGLGQIALMQFGFRLTAPSAPEVKGDTATIRTHVQISLNPILVLRRQADGTWAVDVRASLEQTAAPQRSIFVQQIDILGRADEATVSQAASASQNPWPCMQKMQALAEALNAYADEHDGKYPLAAVWMDAIAPYVEGDKPFQCPEHAKEECSYSFNAALSEQPRPKDWRAGQKTMLLACTGADQPNSLITEADIEKLKPRHGNLTVWQSAMGQAPPTPSGTSLGKLFDEDDKAQACQHKLSLLVDAARRWAKAHGGVLPSAATWCDDLAPLVQKAPDGASPFVCPAAEGASCTYAINRELAGKAMSELVNYRKQLLFVEVEACSLNSAVAPTQEPAARHRRMWNMLTKPGGHRAYLAGNVLLVGGGVP